MESVKAFLTSLNFTRVATLTALCFLADFYLNKSESYESPTKLGEAKGLPAASPKPASVVPQEGHH